MNRAALAVLAILVGLFGVVAVRVLLKPQSSWSQVPHKISLSWTAPASTANPQQLRYNVYRSADNGQSYTQIATKISGTAFDDVNVEIGKTYFYQVSTVDPLGRESARTPAASATVLLNSDSH